MKMTTKTNETAEKMSMVLFKGMAPSVAPLVLPVPNRSSVDIALIAPTYRTELAKEKALEEEKREAERRQAERKQRTRSRRLSRRAVFNSD
jgi:hypothetical protein